MDSFATRALQSVINRFSFVQSETQNDKKCTFTDFHFPLYAPKRIFLTAYAIAKGLFARTYYSLQKDVVRLADILGHCSVNTTRIYTMENGEIHRKQLQELGLLMC